MQPALKSLLFCLLFFFSQKFQCTHYASIVLMAQLFSSLSKQQRFQVGRSISFLQAGINQRAWPGLSERRRGGKGRRRRRRRWRHRLLFSSLAFTCAVFARGITTLCRRSRLSAVAVVCTDHPRMISTTVLPRNKRSDGIGCSSPTYLDLHCRVFLIPHLRENCGRSPIAQNRRKRQREEEEELIKMKYTRETDDFPFPSPTYCFQK